MNLSLKETRMRPMQGMLDGWLGALSAPSFPPWFANGSADSTTALATLGSGLLVRLRKERFIGRPWDRV